MNEESNVTKFPERPAAGGMAPTPEAGVIQLLRLMLQYAEEGRIQGLVGAALNADGTASEFMGGNSNASLIGVLECVRTKVVINKINQQPLPLPPPR